MGKRSSLSSEVIAKMDAYKDPGLSNRAIATKFSRSLKVVNNYLKNPLEYDKRLKGKTYKKVSAIPQADKQQNALFCSFQ